MSRRVWRVRAFGSFWDTYSLMSALILIQSYKLDYGPRCKVSVFSFTTESIAALVREQLREKGTE